MLSKTNRFDRLKNSANWEVCYLLISLSFVIGIETKIVPVLSVPLINSFNSSGPYTLIFSGVQILPYYINFSSFLLNQQFKVLKTLLVRIRDGNLIHRSRNCFLIYEIRDVDMICQIEDNKPYAPNLGKLSYSPNPRITGTKRNVI